MPDFELSYAGKPFRVLPDSMRRQAQELCRIEDMRELDYPANPSPNLSRLGMPRPTVPAWLNLYQFYQPVTASAWGVFRGLAHKDDVDAMATEALPSGGPAAKAFVIGTGSDEPLESSMWLLPPKPLLGVDGATDLYLVTLVDERYYWQFKPMQTAEIGFASYANWDDLIDEILAHLDIESELPTAIESVYGMPEADSDIYANYENPAALLDAALANVGRVLCRSNRADGEYHILRWSEANTYLSTALSNHANRLRAGGKAWELSAATADHRRAAIMPASVVTTFPRWTDDNGYDTDDSLPQQSFRTSKQSGGYDSVYSKTVTAASLGSPYASLTTRAGHTAALHTTAKAEQAEPGDTPTNQTELDDLASRLAKDFYDSKLAATDATYNGVIDWDQKAGLDVVYDYTASITRVVGRPWNRFQSEFQHGFGAKSFACDCSSDGGGSGMVFVDSQEDGESSTSTQHNPRTVFSVSHATLSAAFPDSDGAGKYLLFQSMHFYGNSGTAGFGSISCQLTTNPGAGGAVFPDLVGAALANTLANAYGGAMYTSSATYVDYTGTGGDGIVVGFTAAMAGNMTSYGWATWNHLWRVSD